MADLSQEDLWTLRGLTQKCGWEKFFSHLCCILAEQCEGVEEDSPQQRALWNLSLFLGSRHVIPLTKECGSLDYRGRPNVPEEFRALLERYVP